MAIISFLAESIKLVAPLYSSNPAAPIKAQNENQTNSRVINKTATIYQWVDEQ